jgi:hypothetical protein
MFVSNLPDAERDAPGSGACTHDSSDANASWQPSRASTDAGESVKKGGRFTHLGNRSQLCRAGRNGRRWDAECLHSAGLRYPRKMTATEYLKSLRGGVSVALLMYEHLL